MYCLVAATRQMFSLSMKPMIILAQFPGLSNIQFLIACKSGRACDMSNMLMSALVDRGGGGGGGGGRGP